MTSEQKKQIKKMREKLCTYAEIATSLGLSLNSVKSYCLRNNLNTEALKQNAKLCKNCGNPIMQQAKTMLERGLISADDYAKIDTKLAQKYGIN